MCKGRGSEDVGISVNMEFCGWRGIVFGYDNCLRCLRILLGKCDLGRVWFYDIIILSNYFDNAILSKSRLNHADLRTSYASEPLFLLSIH